MNNYRNHWKVKFQALCSITDKLLLLAFKFLLCQLKLFRISSTALFVNQSQKYTKNFMIHGYLNLIRKLQRFIRTKILKNIILSDPI